ncbi:ABC transporter permease [Halobaculum sp. MBLA0143]|uniref:ABC transporter permease n=1 Tax=Halobaculum sp. MBLA0143 TaxID=3079933 RepID=UPI003524E08E
MNGRAVAIARKDVADAGRSWALWAVVGALVLFTGGTAALFGVAADAEPGQVIGVVAQLSATVFPIVALFVAKGSITSERESGSLRTLLALPPSRREVVIGKFLGRTALVTLATLAGVTVTAVALFTTGNGVGPGLFVPFAVAVWAIAVGFVAVGIGISAAVPTDGWATGVTVGTFLVTVVLWSPLTQGVTWLTAELGLASSRAEAWWIDLFGMLVPNEAAVAVLEASHAGRVFATDPLASVYLPGAILLLWTILPVAVGYTRFRGADLG